VRACVRACVRSWVSVYMHVYVCDACAHVRVWVCMASVDA